MMNQITHSKQNTKILGGLLWTKRRTMMIKWHKTHC